MTTLPKAPATPRVPADPPAAELPRDAVADDAVLSELGFAHTFLEGVGAEFTEVFGCRFDDVNLASSTWYRGSLVDTELFTCDLANAEFTESHWQRVRAERSRLTGLQVAGCTIQNTRLVDCVLDLSNWRFAKVKRVVFERCTFTGSDWNSASLTDVLFDDCDLTDSQFSQATTSQVRFQRCRLDQIKGVASLSGSVIDPVNVIDLSLQLAQALGITIESTAP